MLHKHFTSVALVAASLGLGWMALAVEPPKPLRATTENLGGPERYTTHLTTDKPLYKPGDKLYARALLLDHITRVPMKDAITGTVEIKGPKGDVISTGGVGFENGIASFACDLPADIPGGEYTLILSHPWLGYAPAERKFDIRAYRAPRLKSQILFLRDGYGEGDRVVASLHTERAEGGYPAGAKVKVIARVDGNIAYEGSAKIDSKGNAEVRFDLPKQIERGEGTLALVIDDGGAVETASKTIPILLQTVDLALYPEAGQWVAGLPGRVYFEARTPAQKPADLEGIVMDSKGTQVAAFRTEHEGRGRLSLTPMAGESYSLKITQPSGIRKTFPLPAAQATGVSLQATREVYAAGEPVVLKVAATGVKGDLRLTLSKREVELAASVLERAGNSQAVQEVKLTPPGHADGVLIATVWDAQGQPLAERLIYRQPAHSLRVTLTPDKPSAAPGDKVRLSIKTTDETGKPVSAVVGVTVTDDSVLEMQEKREHRPRLPVMVMLEGEVRELADAHVYLDAANPKAPLATDLLLGTQGWRRFALIDLAKFLETHGDAARRVLAVRVPTPPPLPAAAPAMLMLEGQEAAGGPRVRRLAAAAAPVDELHKNKNGNKPGLVGQDKKANEEAKGKLAAAQKPQAGEKDAGRLEQAGQLQQAVAREKQARGQNAIAGKVRGDRARKEMAAEADFAFAEPAGTLPLIYVREYAHEARPNRKIGDRVDFTETLYFSAGVQTDASGQASVAFSLSDTVGSFRALADALSATGALGEGTAVVESVAPFYMEPKPPLEVTAGDRIDLPLALVNGTESKLAGSLDITVPQGITLTSVTGLQLVLEPRERTRMLLAMNVGEIAGEKDMIFAANLAKLSDRVTRKLRIVPRGFPAQRAQGGMLQAAGEARWTFEIPQDAIASSVATSVKIYPSPVANLTSALEQLIREPYGCFEQTSSTTYPLVMAQQYFTTHTGVNPALIARASEQLDAGYKRLSGFECKKKGYEWFGSDPGHEALTAYGLMQFHDMAKVRSVDPAMVQRTQQWILSRRDGKGGFLRDAKQLDSFGGAPQEHTDAYILWSLLETGQTGLDKEIEQMKQTARSTQDSYVLALAANILQLAKDADGSKAALNKLAQKQEKDGSISGAATSITRSGGQSLAVETTSLAVLGFLRDPAFAGNVEAGVKFLVASCKTGRFGSTQATILALRALIAYDSTRSEVKVPGSVQLMVDGKAVGEAVKFDKSSKETIELPVFAANLAPGKHEVVLRMSEGSDLPYSAAVEFNRVQPESSQQCVLKLGTSLRDASLREGAVTEAEVTVVNTSKEIAATPVAIIGIPGGLEVRHDQLKELVKAQRIAAYEVIGREVVLYWRGLKPGEEVKLPLSLVAAVPGRYTAPASRAYLYYTDEHKQWAPPLTVEIQPAK